MEDVAKFNRFIRVKFNDEIDIEGLRMVFRLHRSFGDATHTLDLSIYNTGKLFHGGDAGIQTFEELTPIVLEAGYKENHSVLFEGIVRNITTTREGTETISKLYCYDAIRVKRKKMNLTIAAPNSIKSIIEQLAESEGISVGEIKIEDRNMKGPFTAYNTFASSMRSIAADSNLVWYIKNKLLYVFSREIGSGVEYVVSNESGMVETPVLTESGINVKMLMAPEIKPQDRFRVISSRFDTSQNALGARNVNRRGLGTNIVETLFHSGDTHGDLWLTEIIGRIALSATQA